MRHVVPITAKSVWRKRSDTGFALVLVLWILGALSVLATVYASYVAATAAETTDYDEPLKDEALAQAALELTAWRELASPPQQRAGQGNFAFRLDDAVVTVNYSCENSRIDLNAAAEGLLAGLLVSFGRSPATAKGYANALSSGGPRLPAQQTQKIRLPRNPQRRRSDSSTSQSWRAYPNCPPSWSDRSRLTSRFTAQTPKSMH